MTTLYVQSPTLYLAGSGVVIGATSVVLTSLTDIYGNVLTMTDFGSLGYITLEPDTTNAEAATFTGVTANTNGTYTLTGVKTLLAKSPYTQTSGLVRNHSGGTKVVVTDNAGFWDTFLNKKNNETVTGKYTFPGDNTNRPTFSADNDTSTATDPVTYGQLQRTAIAGGTPGSTTTLGYVKVSVDPVSAASPIAVGDNDGRVPTQSENDALVGNNGTPSSTNKFVTQLGFQRGQEIYIADASGSSTAYTATFSPAPAALVTGQVLRVKIINANTTTTPTLNVNGLGAVTIVKGVSTALVVGDIAANQFCDFTYNGTNFVLKNPVYTAIPPVTSFVSAIQSVSTTSAGNNDTTITVPFLPTTITIYYSMSGRDSSAAVFNAKGVAYYTGTTLTAKVGFVPNNTATGTAITSTNIMPGTFDAVAPTAGANTGSGNSIQITMTVQSVSSTQVVVRNLTTIFGSPSAATNSFFIIANS